MAERRRWRSPQADPAGLGVPDFESLYSGSIAAAASASLASSSQNETYFE